jgi:hypothetical protein
MGFLNFSHWDLKNLTVFGSFLPLFGDFLYSTPLPTIFCKKELLSPFVFIKIHRWKPKIFKLKKTLHTRPQKSSVKSETPNQAPPQSIIKSRS